MYQQNRELESTISSLCESPLSVRPPLKAALVRLSLWKLENVWRPVILVHGVVVLFKLTGLGKECVLPPYCLVCVRLASWLVKDEDEGVWYVDVSGAVWFISWQRRALEHDTGHIITRSLLSINWLIMFVCQVGFLHWNSDGSSVLQHGRQGITTY